MKERNWCDGIEVLFKDDGNLSQLMVHQGLQDAKKIISAFFTALFNFAKGGNL